MVIAWFQDTLYNPETKTGLLLQKIYYQKRKKSAAKRSTMDLRDEDVFDIDELTDFFKKCVLPNDKSTLMTTFRDTAETRKRFLENNERAIIESSLNLYVVSPDLVFIIIQLKRNY